MRPTLTLLLVLLALPACDDDEGSATRSIPDASADAAPGDAELEALPDAPADVASVLTAAVVVTPANPSHIPNRTTQMHATAVYHDGTLAEVTSQASWTSSRPHVATVSGAGLVSTLNSGETTITAEYQGVSGSTTFLVTTVASTGVVVMPASAGVARGTSRQFTVHLMFADGTSSDGTEAAQWSVDHPAIATVSTQDNQRGLVQALAEGQTTVRAMLAGYTGSATLTVTAP